ncbi:5-(carboxyamino)imidazole ribonucleotide mutase [Candidatus Gottesmanbacteria bacterium RIFCSPLOWO2_01_FULL_39_12b]|uniref:N5-carboxyaminoimidazole ribonucleotide mutase n=1 Tax=Candidatus Gottesmanbacteria bacterium RIFCSPLOWO2_01_FULL_39_12b TaxID=1798388 RepID=A0A1F6AQ52_9BACT|nr:MAG: 5-(carboxyamino)imidazole ribonucleotide mutase [Candidatus Gottesmanbacteria bacterium RIFCSPLOWO2_01_FULL_39_12b]
MVIIILGSKSDLNWGKEIGKHLNNFCVSYKIHIASAHKTPEHLLRILKKYESSNNPIIYICVAGRSNALGGFVDSNVVHPVINCPPYSEKYAGLDILSSLRMPSGVSPMTVLEPDQVAVAAAKILGCSEAKYKEKILAFHQKLRNQLLKDDEEVTVG